MRQVLGPGALGRPRGIGWRGRWEGGSGWGIHVNPWLIHVSVWQNPLKCCEVISFQLIKINEKNKNKIKYLFLYFGCAGPLLLHVGFLQLQRAGVTLHRGMQPSQCSGFSWCGACALGAGFRSYSMWAQSCPVAHRNLPRSGIIPCTPRWQADS